MGFSEWDIEGRWVIGGVGLGLGPEVGRRLSPEAVKVTDLPGVRIGEIEAFGYLWAFHAFPVEASHLRHYLGGRPAAVLVRCFRNGLVLL